MSLFKIFIANRSICDGFSLTSSAIQVKQYDFAGMGNNTVSQSIKACVGSLQSELKELGQTVFDHHNELDKGVEQAITTRRNELTTQAKRDQDADPWSKGDSNEKDSH